MRYWHFKGMSARPQHRMVAHTGFITSARRLADGEQGYSPRTAEPPLREPEGTQQIGCG